MEYIAPKNPFDEKPVEKKQAPQVIDHIFD